MLLGAVYIEIRCQCLFLGPTCVCRVLTRTAGKSRHSVTVASLWHRTLCAVTESLRAWLRRGPQPWLLWPATGVSNACQHHPACVRRYGNMPDLDHWTSQVPSFHPRWTFPFLRLWHRWRLQGGDGGMLWMRGLNVSKETWTHPFKTQRCALLELARVHGEEQARRFRSGLALSRRLPRRVPFVSPLNPSASLKHSNTPRGGPWPLRPFLLGAFCEFWLASPQRSPQNTGVEKTHTITRTPEVQDTCPPLLSPVIIPGRATSTKGKSGPQRSEQPRNRPSRGECQRKQTTLH